MNVLYVGPLSEGGTCLMRMRAMQALGHKAIPLDSDPAPHSFEQRRLLPRIARKIGRPLDLTNVNGRLLVAVKEHRPDILWIDKGLGIWPMTLEEVRTLTPETKLVGYSPDDMGRRHNQSSFFLKSLALYDLFFTTKPFNVTELRAMGARRVVQIGEGFDPDTHKPAMVTAEDRQRLGSPVGFVGAWERDRGEKMLALADAGVHVRVWGWQPPRGWSKPKHACLNIEGRPLWGDEYAKALSSFDIALCFLRKINRDVTTSRSVEIPACGTFMLAERTNEHLELFEEGKEAEFFDNKEELIDKCKFYLANSAARFRIAEAGRERCLKSGYSNYDRVRTMLQEVMKLRDLSCQ